MGWVVFFSRLNNLFSGLDESSSLRYVVYMSLIKLAGRSNLIHLLNPKLEELRSWLTLWDVGTAKSQTLLRGLYEAFTECRQRYYQSNCCNWKFHIVNSHKYQSINFIHTF